ncbi:hypothetical protein AB0L65_20830 [Nonomuraea sp. NPDC052116]|uniref:DUF6197 family protein n=1 Tax=Nonomuraea sp. NPDC052116 TaxID=3155665 RepID=UPI0034288413
MTAATLAAHNTLRRDAAATLRQLGWIQGDYIKKRGFLPRHVRPVCMVEAIGRAAGLPPAALGRAKRPSDPDMAEKWDTAQDLIGEISTFLGRNPQSAGLTPRAWLTNWNDRKGRALDEVLAALEGEASQ